MLDLLLQLKVRIGTDTLKVQALFPCGLPQGMALEGKDMSIVQARSHQHLGKVFVVNAMIKRL